MAYSKSKELTDTEKRLQALKTQLFGKEGNQIKAPSVVAVNTKNSNSVASFQHQDLTYLKKDLRKIALLAFLAIGAQILLYMQFTLKLLKFN